MEGVVGEVDGPYRGGAVGPEEGEGEVQRCDAGARPEVDLGEGEVAVRIAGLSAEMASDDGGLVDACEVSGHSVALTERRVSGAVVGDECSEFRRRGLVQFFDQSGR